jgi:hypothetical protein
MTAKKATKKPSAKAADSCACGTVDARAIRERLIARILNNADDIVGGVTEAAKSGNYLPARFLFEFAGIMEPAPPKTDSEVEAQNRVRSLAEILLDAAQSATKDHSQQTQAGCIESVRVLPGFADGHDLDQ